MQEEVRFDYFYNLFKQKFEIEAFEFLYPRIGIKVCRYQSLGLLYYTAPLTSEERIAIFDKILPLVCKDYVKLINSRIELSVNPLEAVKQILDSMECNPYQESFLLSFSFIFRDYLECLGKGSPVLWVTSSEFEEPTFMITMNSRYEMTDFDAINTGLVEEAKTMLRILTLEKNNQIGPIPNVTFRYRKDI